MSRVKPGGKTNLPEAPDVERHDEVYFRHASGPRVGRVLARGAHGCTVDSDGVRHRVRWQDLHGHKTRVRPEVKVVDQGEDGLLVEDRAGRRRFIGDVVGAEEPGLKPMGKALGPVVLFLGHGPDLLKAMGREVKGRAGLQLQNVTDRAGHATKRWKKSGAETPGGETRPTHGEHNVKPGHSVKFTLGSLNGAGRVTATGGRGVTVSDAEGHSHKVEWDQITHHDAGETKTDRSVEGDRVEGRSGSEVAGQDAGLFDARAVDALPDRAKQPHGTWDDLSRHSAEALGQFREALGGVAQQLGLRTDVAKPDDLSDADVRSREGFLFVGPLKGENRAKEKVEAEYDGDWSEVRDMIRATITVSSLDELKVAVAAVGASGLSLAQKPKDKFAKPTAEGYRDLNTVVKLPSGMLAEVQYHLKPMTAAKATAHKDYQSSRTLQAKYGEGSPSESWSDADHAAFHQAVKRQRDAYSAAWSAATAAKKPLDTSR